jgi:purine-binding chemotaxis protein CheW
MAQVADSDDGGTRMLIVRAGGRLCGLPLSSVVEIMRPLPVQALAGLPAYLRGLAVIRGQPLPVVDVSTLLAGVADDRIGRFLTMRGEGRPFSLAVEAVLGMRAVDRTGLRAIPELREPARELVDSVGALGTELLTVLKASRAFSDEMWAGIHQAQGPRS